MNSFTRSTLVLALVVLSFAIGEQSISQVNHQIDLVNPGEKAPLNKLFSRLVEGKGPYLVTPEPSENNQSRGRVVGNVERVHLSVSIFENSSTRLRPVRGARVNVTMSVPSDENDVESEEVLVPVASGVTDLAGKATFTLDPGNYTLVTEHYNLVGNYSISLTQASKQTSVRWVFYNSLEHPIIVQLNKVNGDEWLSTDETITLFYQSSYPIVPSRIVMRATYGQREATYGFTIIRLSIFPHGTWAILSPLQPIPISVFQFGSKLQFGTIWSEATSII